MLIKHKYTKSCIIYKLYALKMNKPPNITRKIAPLVTSDVIMTTTF